MKRNMILIALCAAGCVHTPPASKFPALEQQLEKPRASYSSGSLWQGAGGGLVEDFKARGKGDILTVVITETASASKEATTGTGTGVRGRRGHPQHDGTRESRHQ